MTQVSSFKLLTPRKVKENSNYKEIKFNERFGSISSIVTREYAKIPELCYFSATFVLRKNRKLQEVGKLETSS